MKTITHYFFLFIPLVFISFTTTGQNWKYKADTTQVESKSENLPQTEVPEEGKNKQANPAIRYIGSFAVGYAQPLTGLKAKFIFGSKVQHGDGGLFLELSTYQNQWWWMAGLQTNFHWFNWSIGYGIGEYKTETTFQIEDGNQIQKTETRQAFGLRTSLNYRINLDTQRKIFLEIGAGYFFSDNVVFFSGKPYQKTAFYRELTFFGGLGFRF